MDLRVLVPKLSKRQVVCGYNSEGRRVGIE